MSIKLGKVERYLLDKITRGENVHLTLFDPEEVGLEKAGEIALRSEEAGTDGIMVGGSTFFSQNLLDEFIKRIKEKVSIPIILFPNNITAISRYADAIWFMSLLNSVDHYYIIGAQAQGSILVKQYGLEAIPMGYLVFGGETAVAAIGRVLPLPPNQGEVAACYALAAQYLGMRFIYLEAGSGARTHIPSQTIRRVAKTVDIPVIVGGGIRSGEAAEEVIKAGADIVVTGTVVERDYERYRSVVKAVKSSISKP